jgi:hypothetical protein
MGTISPPGAATLLAILEAAPGAPEDRIRALVESLDLAICADDSHGLPRQALARAVAALGPPLLATMPGGRAQERISATAAAARAYARNPGDSTELELFHQATNSYPFGPGDGHYGTAETSTACQPGSGCQSGAGTLLFAARAAGFTPATRALTASLSPWLRTWPA